MEVGEAIKSKAVRRGGYSQLKINKLVLGEPDLRVPSVQTVPLSERLSAKVTVLVPRANWPRVAPAWRTFIFTRTMSGKCLGSS